MQPIIGTSPVSMRVQVPLPRAHAPSSIGASTFLPPWVQELAPQRTVPAAAVGAGGGGGFALWWWALGAGCRVLGENAPSTAAAATPTIASAISAPMVRIGRRGRRVGGRLPGGGRGGRGPV